MEMTQKKINEYNNIIVENLNVICYISTIDTYELIYFNDIGLDLFDLSEEDYKGRKCYEVLQGLDEPCSFCTHKHLKEGELYRWDFYNPVVDKHFSLHDTLIHHKEHGLVKLEIAYDITKESKMIQQLYQTLDLEDTILMCAKTLLDDTDIDQSINTLLEMVNQYYQGDRTYIFEVNEENQTWNNTYEACSDGISQEIDRLQNIPLNDVPMWTNLLQTKQEIYIASVSQAFDKDSLEYELLTSQNIHSMILIPLQRKQTVIGFIGVDNPMRSQNNHSLLRTVAVFVVNDIGKRRITKALEEQVDQLKDALSLEGAMLACATTLLDEHTDTSKSMKSLLKIVSEYYQAQRAYVFEVQYDEQNFCTIHEFCEDGIRPLKNKMHVVTPKFLKRLSTVCQKKGLVNISKMFSKSSKEYRLCQTQNISSLMLKALVKDNQLYGFLGIDSPKNRKKEPNLLNAVSAFIMNDLEKRRMFEKLEYLSYIDHLTNVYNRNRFLMDIEDIERKQLDSLGVIFVDVNSLKKVNDYWGHEYGDILIKWCVKFLKECLQMNVYRIGGDEFVALVRNEYEQKFYALAQHLKQESMKIDYVHMSIGCDWSKNPKDVSKQIAKADKMMYQAKEEFYAVKKACMEQMNMSEETYMELVKEKLIALEKTL